MSSQNPIEQALNKAREKQANTQSKPTTVLKLDNEQLDNKLNNKSKPSFQISTAMPAQSMDTVFKDTKDHSSALHNQPTTANSTMSSTNNTANNKTINKSHAISDNATQQTLFQKVDIGIAGTTHRINCPKAKANTLISNAESINNNLRAMRKNVHGKSPTNEELLVLHCLDLYDTIDELRNQINNHDLQNSKLDQALDKVIESVKSIG